MVASALVTVEEYMALCERGVFGDRPTGLVKGEIEFEMSHGKRHGSTSTQALRTLLWLDEGDTVVYNEVTIALSNVDARDPDLVVALRTDMDRGPVAPSDVLLAVEVGDSSSRRDLEVKRIQYATAAIREYWVIDPAQRSLHVFRDPHQGDYLTSLNLHEKDEVVFHDRTLKVMALLPKLRR